MAQSSPFTHACFYGTFTMARTIRIGIPEAPSSGRPPAKAERALSSKALRIGVLDNRKANADHLLNFVVDGLKAGLAVQSVVVLRKATASMPAPQSMLDQL